MTTDAAREFNAVQRIIEGIKKKLADEQVLLAEDRAAVDRRLARFFAIREILDDAEQNEEAE